MLSIWTVLFDIFRRIIYLGVIFFSAPVVIFAFFMYWIQIEVELRKLDKRLEELILAKR